jgi:hypothetical protein
MLNMKSQPVTVADLEQQLADLEPVIEAAEAEAGRLILDSAPPADCAAAVEKITRHRAERTALTAALDQARSRDDAAAAAEIAKTTTAAWQETEKMLEQRKRLAEGMEADILHLADRMIELREINATIWKTCPVRLGSIHNTGLAIANVEHSVRLYMRKQGFKWAADYSLGVDRIPTITDTVRETNKAIRSKKLKVVT